MFTPWRSDDRVQGMSGADDLSGGAGDDILNGGSFADTLDGRARAGQPGFHGPLVDRERLRQLVVAQPFHLAQQDDLPLLGGQAGQRRIQVAQPLPTLQLRLGPGLLGRGVVVVIQRHELHDLAPPQNVQRRVGRDAIDPGVKLRVRPPCGQGLPCFYENVLRQFQSVLP